MSQRLSAPFIVYAEEKGQWEEGHHRHRARQGLEPFAAPAMEPLPRGRARQAGLNPGSVPGMPAPGCCAAR
ncbi:Uncharacterised protein [Bordetella pertussis]|nr:Uncharacterised protein [Bordetella pertussis]